MWLNKDKWLNELWCGDNIEVLKNIPAESVDLIYIDPPFFSGKKWEIIWGNGAERRSFEDFRKGGINNYILWLEKRIKEMHRILKPTGAMYIHLDWHAVHYAKVMLDSIFGYDNFRNEVIWHYGQRNMHRKKKWNAKHDTILFYAKTSKTVIKNIITEPWTEEEIVKKRARKILVDKNGRKYIIDNRSVSKGYPAKKQYIDDIIAKGKAIDDVWDIPMIVSTSSERIGYPTQKPEALLERIIKSTSNEEDVVLDAFCGCGTTIAVAERLNRKWIGLDISPIAVKIMTERLQIMEKKMGKLEDFITFGLPKKTIPQLRKMTGFEFEDFIIQQINGEASARKVHDYGIDSYNKDGVPIQMKNSERVGRNVVDNFTAAIGRVKSKKGQIYAISFGKGAHEEVARLKREDEIDIELIDMKEFLTEKFGDHTHRN